MPLRKAILVNHDLKNITYFREDAKLFEGVTQSTVIFSACNAPESANLSVTNRGETFEISKDIIKNCFPLTLEIPLVDQTGC